MNLLKDKVIVIFGGAGLLGSAFSIGAIKEGATVIVADKDDTQYHKADDKSAIEFQIADITSHESIDNVIKRVVKKYKKIDTILNTAYPRNKDYGKKLEEITYSSFCSNVDIHLGGYFLVSQRSALYFKNQGWGNIINIASIQGVSAPKFDTYCGTEMTSPIEYSAIKAGIIHMTRYIAKYLKGFNIRCNCISPGGILDGQDPGFIEKYTNYTINKGMLDKEDVVGTFLFLASDFSKYINGQNIIIDDGWTL